MPSQVSFAQSLGVLDDSVFSGDRSGNHLLLVELCTVCVLSLPDMAAAAFTLGCVPSAQLPI